MAEAGNGRGLVLDLVDKAPPEAGNGRGLVHEIEQDKAAAANATAIEVEESERTKTLQKEADVAAQAKKHTSGRISQFKVKLGGIVKGIDVADKFAEQTFVDAEKDLARAKHRHDRAAKMTLRAQRLINGTQGWLERQRLGEEMVRVQGSADAAAQRKMREEANRLKEEEAVDGRILRGLVKENLDEFGHGR